MSGWGCPHERKGACARLGGTDCDPGRKGCILQGRFRFSNQDKDALPRPRGAAGNATGGGIAMRKGDTPDGGGSAPCWMDKADDAYMGYADRDELLAFLGDMLAAERAGAQVCHESLEREPPPWMSGLLKQIKRDEGRWCIMLSSHISALGGMPGDTVGAFRDKAMAIADAQERLTFLNRGQDWVIRKLRVMLPRIRDDRLHADLTEMLRAHEANIDLACKAMEAS